MSLPGKKIRLADYITPAMLAVLAIGLVVYLSQLQYLNKMMDDWDALGEQIAVIEMSFGQDRKQFMAGVRSLQEQYEQIMGRLPPKDQQGVRLISDEAREYELEVVAIRSGEKTAFLDGQKLPVRLEGKSVQSSYISLELKGSYANLARYLASLGDLPVYVTVERLKVVPNPAQPGSVAISLGLNFYLLS